MQEQWEKEKISFLHEKEEMSLNNDEWVAVSRKNIQERLNNALKRNNPSTVSVLIMSLKDYQHMAQQMRGIDEALFVNDAILNISESNLREPVLGMLEGSLWEIAMVRKMAKELDDEIKSRGMWPQVDVRKLDQSKLSFITHSNLAILFLISLDEPFVETDFFSEKLGTPPARLASLQRMYEKIIQVLESGKLKNTLVQKH